MDFTKKINDLYSLKKLREEIHQTAKDKGFWPLQGRNLGELLMLVTSELSEALEADRKGRWANIAQFRYHISTTSDTSLNYSKAFELSMKDSVEDEIADAIIRLLDLSSGLNINIEEHIIAKMEYNKLRVHLNGKNY